MLQRLEADLDLVDPKTISGNVASRFQLLQRPDAAVHGVAEMRVAARTVGHAADVVQQQDVHAIQAKAMQAGLVGAHHPIIAVVENRHERQRIRSEEHTSELQSLMRISYAVFGLQKNNNNTKQI